MNPGYEQDFEKIIWEYAEWYPVGTLEIMK